jgi:hypothetical protein
MISVSSFIVPALSVRRRRHPSLKFLCQSSFLLRSGSADRDNGGEQSFMASPVIVDGDIYLRSQTHLFRVGS